MAQQDHHREGALRLHLAARFVAGKLQNSRQLLLRAARDATGRRQATLRGTAEGIAESLAGLSSATTLEIVMGVEGQAARRYVATWPDLLTPHARISAPTRRVSRPPTDPMNAALSFGYGLLRVAVEGAVEQVGLDPSIGYLHGIRPNKPSLALDLMEEFRALLVDRTVFTAFNQRQLTPGDFRQMPGGSYQLPDDGRRSFLRLWSDARAREWGHPWLRSDVPAALLPLVQTRILTRYLRGDIAAYVLWSPG